MDNYFKVHTQILVQRNLELSGRSVKGCDGLPQW